MWLKMKIRILENDLDFIPGLFGIVLEEKNKDYNVRFGKEICYVPKSIV